MLKNDNDNGLPKPGLITGGVVGLLLTLPLSGILYLAARVFGTAFVPFDLFDLLARILPGKIIELGLGFILSIIAALNLEDTSSSAKLAEHLLAIVTLQLIGMIAGAFLFALLRRREGSSRPLAGLLTGAVVGAPLAVISGTFNQATSVDPLFNMVWIVVAFLIWGVLLVRVYNHLLPLPVSDEQIAPNTLQVLDRRRFLMQVGGATAVITVSGAGLGALLGKQDEPEVLAWSDINPLPNAAAAVQPAAGTRSELTPVRDHYRIDINTLPPVIWEADYQLKISGLVSKPLNLTLADIRDNYEPVHEFITLSCISNSVGGDLIGTQRWTGVPLKHILQDALPTESGQFINIYSADGFHESLSRAAINTDERIMLVYAWDDQPLTTAHGFPLRIFIPDRYGMKQPKWITEIEVVEYEEEGFWVRRGWDQLAQVRSTSVIDTVALNESFEQDGQQFIPIGGMAYAGKRGISGVFVRVDQGEWQEAVLREPLSDLTWVLWRYDWPFQPGGHTFTVRCVDGRGAEQIQNAQPERPSGATGLHRKSV